METQETAAAAQPDAGQRPLFTNADLRRLLLPLIGEQFLVIAVGMADTMMVSCLGENAVAGVTLIDMLNNFIFHIFSALATGGAVVASQFLGARRLESARRSALQLIWVNLALSLLLLAFSELGSTWIIRGLFGEVSGEVFASATTYFRVTALSFPLFAVFCSCGALIRSQNAARLTLYAAVVSNVINVAGNALLIHGLGLGVAGAASATVVARLVAMAMLVWYLRDRSRPIYLSLRENPGLEPQLIRRILRIGVPSGVESGIFQFGRVIVVAVIAAFGSTQLAANAVANNIDYLGCLVGAAFCLAVITVVGQAVGAGDVEVVRFYVRKMMKLACIWHLVWNVVVFAITPLCLACYTLSDETYWLTVKLILIHNGIGMFIWPWTFVFPNALRAANDVRFMMVVSVASMVLARVGGSYLLGGTNFLGWGALGVWWAMIADWLVRIVCFVWRYRSGRWLRHFRD